MLLSSAMELGGTNPKCVVRLGKSDDEWVVRHASAREPVNSALWMAVTRELAQACGIKVVEGKLIAPRLYAERRFDRAEDGSPLLCFVGRDACSTADDARADPSSDTQDLS